MSRHKILDLPLLRGAVILIEALVLGIQALLYSGDLVENDSPSKNNDTQRLPGSRSFSEKLYMSFTLTITFAIGLTVFFYIPLVLTDLTGVKSGISFNLIDGIIRLIFFIGYIILISQSRDIKRVFEYHGAEHKSIFNHEAKRPLSPETASMFSRFHPRCGTSFLLVVMLMSTIIFIFLGRPENISERLFRLLFIPVIGGLSYEFIRLSGKKANSSFLKLFITPGLWLQRLTTCEPDLPQLEVAIVALKAALGENISDIPHVNIHEQHSSTESPA